jgi:Outer membrane protein beta-barrel domain
MMNSWLGPKPYARLNLRVLLGFLALALPMRAQKQELAFSLGGIVGQTRAFNSPTTGQVNISAGKSFGVNYGYRLVNTKVADLYGEVEFAAPPNQTVDSSSATVARNYASLYVTPGIRLKIFPAARFSPWGVIGGGYALYQQGSLLSNGQATTNRFLNRGVFEFGGGIDFRLIRFVGLRAEVRDFVSGNPNLNVRLDSSTQHNVISSGAVVFRF